MAKPDRNFSSGGDHDKNDEDLPIHLLELVGKGDEEQVGGVEHQFQGHEDDNGILTQYQHPQSPCRKG